MLNSANMVAENPTMDPMDRSTTPPSSAKAEHVPTTIGIATNDPISAMLLFEKKVPPTQTAPTRMTTASAMAMVPTALSARS